MKLIWAVEILVWSTFKEKIYWTSNTRFVHVQEFTVFTHFTVSASGKVYNVVKVWYAD